MPFLNDLVEYFGEMLDGFAFTRNGWVQSYRSRYVKPPILFGDVQRPIPMTVDWIKHAQSLTSKPVKGMLTGPVTILEWSFVRDDQPRSETIYQIALAIRDEVLDLERANIRIIQLDEPALRRAYLSEKKIGKSTSTGPLKLFAFLMPVLRMKRKSIHTCVILNSMISLKVLRHWMPML